MSMKITRRHAREAALQLLFELEFNPDVDESRAAAYLHERLDFPELERFALDLVQGVRRRLPEIDSVVASASKAWSVQRMPPLDRNVVRMAVYEFRFDPRTPAKVAINEAIELAKKFSTMDSVAFVNGVLDRIAGLKTTPAPATPPTPAASEEPVE